MAYYYYYHQHQVPPGPQSPGATITDVTPLLLLSPSQQQHQLNLPILTPVLPSTSVPITTTTEYDQQHQLPTPNTFIKHCEDIGLFHDLQNVSVMSSLSGQQADTVTTESPVTTINTNTSMVATSTQSVTSNVFSSSSTMMMANPFDETFKQAVLQQQNSDENLSKKVFNNYKNNNNDLNTPFIVPTTVEILNSNNTVTSEFTPNVVIEVPTSIKPISMTASTTVSQSQQENNVYIPTKSIQNSTSSGGVLLMVMDQQQTQQQNLAQPQQSCIVERRQRVIVPNTTMIANRNIDSTHTYDNQQNYCDKDDNIEVVTINIGNETTSIKQTLKRNLLVKRLIQGQQKSSLISKKQEQQEQQHNYKIIDGNHTTSINKDNRTHNENKDENKKLRQKQELLERNRSAAKRCRIKRKQRWDLLSEENRKLKAENSKLRNALTKLITSGCSYQQQI